MSNMKMVSLIDHEVRRVRSDEDRARTALAADLYDALRSMIAPLVERLDALEASVADLRRDLTGDGR